MPGTGDRLRELRKARGWSQPFVAQKLGVTRAAVSQWETEQSKIDQKRLEAVARLYEVTIDHILRDDQPTVDIHNRTSRASSGSNASIPVKRSSLGVELSRWPKTIQILGFAKGGRQGNYPDNGNVIGMAPCPPQLQDVAGAYAVIVQDTSMEPRYHHNEIVYINPHKVVRPGDYVIIELRDGDAVVKRLVRRTAALVTCKQYNPAKLIEYDAGKVKNVHRIVLGGEDPT